MWALGVTLYCLCFSKTPFDGATVMEVYEQIRSQQLVYPQGCAPILVDLLGRLLDRDPERRITASQVLAHPYLQGTIRRTK